MAAKKARRRKGSAPAKVWWKSPPFQRGSVLQGYVIYPYTFSDSEEGRWLNFKLCLDPDRNETLPGGVNFWFSYNLKTRRFSSSTYWTKLLDNLPGQLYARGHHHLPDRDALEARCKKSLEQLLDFYVAKCDNGTADWPARYVPKAK